MTGIVVGTLAIVAITLVLGLWLNRRVPLLPAPGDFETDHERARKQRVTHGAGEAPATALRVRGTQLERLRASQRCASCRAPIANEADDEVQFGGATLLVLHFTCPSCARRRALYIDPAPPK